MARAILVAMVAVLTFPVAAQEAVSPLVEAAKRANRAGKKPARVITNDDVAASRGRLSGGETNATPAPSIGSPAPLPDWASVEAANAARLAEQARQQRASATPPPQTEGSSRASYSVRPSSVTNATMGSTAATTMRPSSTQTVGGQATASSSNYDQTASASNRQAAAPTRRD